VRDSVGWQTPIGGHGTVTESLGIAVGQECTIKQGQCGGLILSSGNGRNARPERSNYQWARLGQRELSMWMTAAAVGKRLVWSAFSTFWDRCELG